VQQCLIKDLGNASSVCDNCVASGLLTNATTCAEYIPQVCSVIDSCPCGSCDHKLADFLTCTNPLGCVVDCAAPRTPQYNVCSTRQTELNTCLQANLPLSEGVTCEHCVTQALSNATYGKCDQLDANLCSTIASCSCGSCSSSIKAFLNCTFTELIGCPINCSS
jgi:hypothetical protein